MSLRRTAALAVAVALVGGLYYWYEVEGSKRRRAAEERQKRLLDVEPEAVSAVTLIRGGTTLRAVRRGGAWHLTSPIEARADQETVGRLVEAASQAKRIRLIDEKPSDLKAFGLASPRLTIALDAAGKSFKLAIGEESPTGRGVYARAGSEGPVVLLERAAERASDKKLIEFRDKRLFEVPAKDVTSLRIARGAGAIALEKGSGGAWTLKEPLEAAVAPSAVDDLLGTLTRGRILRFIDEPESDPSLYGLTSPRVSLTLTTRDGRTIGPLHLGGDLKAKGAEAASSARLYARRGEAGPVLVLEEKILKAVPTDATALRDRRLLAYELDDVERLEVVSADETIVVERRGGRVWTMVKPLEAEADESAVRNLLWDLKAVKAKEFLDGADPAEARFDFGPAVRLYALRLKGRSGPLRLEVGAEAVASSARYVRLLGRKGLVTVGADELKKLEVTSLKLRDRRLLAFEPEEARRVEVSGKNRSVALWKDGSRWQLTRPERRELSTGRVTALLWTLKRLKFSGVIEERRAGEPAGEALLEARVWTGSSTPERVAVVRASGKEGRTPVAFGSAKPGLYTVAESALEETEKEIERLLARSE